MSGRLALVLCVLAAQTLFLWMFLAADPLEQMALARACDPSGVANDAREMAWRFAAAWRHGMTGNAPLYMPGFFAVAATTWFWIGAHRGRWWIEGAALLTIALGIATIAAPIGARWIVDAFQRASGYVCRGPLPAPTWQAIVVSEFTLITWSAFVIASQRALSRRSFRPFLPVPVLWVGLALVRPWTVDDFTGDWVHRVGAGDLVAMGSFLAVPGLSLVLARHELRQPRPD